MTLNISTLVNAILLAKEYKIFDDIIYSKNHLSDCSDINIIQSIGEIYNLDKLNQNKIDELTEIINNINTKVTFTNKFYDIAKKMILSSSEIQFIKDNKKFIFPELLIDNINVFDYIIDNNCFILNIIVDIIPSKFLYNKLINIINNKSNNVNLICMIFNVVYGKYGICDDMYEIIKLFFEINSLYINLLKQTIIDFSKQYPIYKLFDSILKIDYAINKNIDLDTITPNMSFACYLHTINKCDLIEKYKNVRRYYKKYGSIYKNDFVFAVTQCKNINCIKFKNISLLLKKELITQFIKIKNNKPPIIDNNKRITRSMSKSNFEDKKVKEILEFLKN